MTAQEVIGIIPDEFLDNLAIKTKVDCFVKKLKGKIVFKLFLYAVLSGKTISLRILETIFNSDKFKRLFNFDESTIKHSGIGMRLTSIDYRYFEKIFEYLINSQAVDKIIFSNKKVNIRKIDSTIVTLSSKLLKIGMNNRDKKNLKYAIEINQGIPVNLILFKDQKYFSENNALPELIKKKSAKCGLNIAIFDRGVQRKQTFVELAKENIYFISRLSNQKYTIVKDLPLKKKSTATLKIISDQIIKFQSAEETIEQEFRLIVGVNKESGQKISFLTNVYFLSADEITDLYLSRWEIEIFFRFIKQELNFSHLLNRSENGIRALMYLTMIAAILLTIYKKTNKIIGWTVTKIKFLNELEIDLMNNWHFEMSPVFNHSNIQYFAYPRDF